MIGALDNQKNGAELKEEIARLRAGLNDVLELVRQLPSGLDLDADPADTSPEDAVAHIGGLIAARIAAITTGARPVWGKERPTAPGLYWYRDDFPGVASLLVVDSPAGLRVLAFGCSVDDPIEIYTGEWWPVPPPECIEEDEEERRRT